VLQAALQVLLYAVVAGLSPLAFAATIAVMHAGRPQALGFGIGFVGAQLLTCSIFVAIGVAASGSSRKHYPGVQIALEVAIAFALVWLAGRVRRRPPTTGEATSARTRRLFERLGRLRLLTALGAGLLLGIAAPKRLVLVALAATAINTSGLRNSSQAVLVIAYSVVATALVWGPVVLFVIFGERAIALMKRAQGEVGRRQPQVTAYALLVLAAMFLIDAVGVLLTTTG
jgi:Sap, sulfolipid-1-addressing protein